MNAEAEERRVDHDWVEILATVLLAMAAVATAWSGYQASRWNGEQVKTASRNNAARIAAARAEALAEAETEIDVALFIQWVDARANGDRELEEFYEARFRPEFQPAFDAWLETDPLTNPAAPATPFKMPEYRLEATKDAKELDAETKVLSTQVHRDVQRSTNYVLGVVLFAVALFFAGLAPKLHGKGSRTALLVTGCVVFVTSAAWIASFPKSFDV